MFVDLIKGCEYIATLGTVRGIPCRILDRVGDKCFLRIDNVRDLIRRKTCARHPACGNFERVRYSRRDIYLVDAPDAGPVDNNERIFHRAPRTVHQLAETVFVISGFNTDVHDIADHANHNKKEAIYTTQYNKGNGNSGMHALFLPYYAGWNAESISEHQAFGGAIVPSQAFIDSYETGDKRAQEKGWYYNSYNGVNFPQPFVYKYFDAEATVSNQSDVQFYMLRYSDVLLTLAEAACAGGSTTDADAIDAYYKVRNRWCAIPKPTSISFEDVYKERVWELCFEGQNWFDILRTRKVFNVSNKRVVDMVGFTPQEHTGQPFTDECLLFPYPVAEKRLNSNLSLTVAERLAKK